MAKHPLYDTYKSMLGRCYYKLGPSYKNYGGKGVYVCDRWRGRIVGFKNFIADMGPKPTPMHTLERRDSSGPYSPGNCRWATRREQLLNTSRTRKFERDGIVYKASEVAEQYGLSPTSVIARAETGASFAEIVSRHHLDPNYDHMAEMVKKSATIQLEKTHCANGHELSGANLSYRKDGWKVCRRCSADAQRRYRERKAKPVMVAPTS